MNNKRACRVVGSLFLQNVLFFDKGFRPFFDMGWGIISLEVKEMTNIFQQVAERNGTTEQEVRDEIAIALQLAGINENPEKFIKNIAAQIKERTNYNK